MQFVAENEPLLDAILYDWFPHALPGELDDMDILRFFRMVEAKRIMAAEDLRAQNQDGDYVEPDKKAPKARRREWFNNVMTWVKHDKLLDDFGDFGD